MVRVALGVNIAAPADRAEATVIARLVLGLSNPYAGAEGAGRTSVFNCRFPALDCLFVSLLNRSFCLEHRSS